MRAIRLSDIDEVPARFGVDAKQLSFLKPRYNVAPSQQMPVIPSDNPTELTIMRWGLIPYWAKEANPKGIINAEPVSQ